MPLKLCLQFSSKILAKENAKKFCVVEGSIIISRYSNNLNKNIEHNFAGKRYEYFIDWNFFSALTLKQKEEKNLKFWNGYLVRVIYYYQMEKGIQMEILLGIWKIGDKGKLNECKY